MQLSKKDKKIARRVIDLGLQKEFENGLNSFDGLINDWKTNKKDNGESYRLLYKTISDFDKHIARRYDAITGSKYIYIVAALLIDNIVCWEDVKEFIEETILKLKMLTSR